MRAPTLSAILFILSIFVVPSLQSDYDTAMAFEMLRASSAAYCLNSELANMDCGAICNDLSGYVFEKQYVYTISSAESVSFSTFFNHDENIFVASFRGTQGDTQLVDELLQSSATSYLLHNIPNAVVSGYFYDKYVTYIRDDFLSAIQEAAIDHPDYQFYMVGHSLGGALATMASLDAVLSQVTNKDNTYLYTYGCPRVGDYNFANAVVNNVGLIYRVTHHKDIVPHIPPCRVDWNLACDPNPNHGNEDGVLLFHAWHVWPEVYYSGNTQTDFKICWDGEDPTCSDQFTTVLDDIADHLMYMGMSTGCAQSPINT